MKGFLREVWVKIVVAIAVAALLALATVVWHYLPGALPTFLNYSKTQVPVSRWQLGVGIIVTLSVGYLLGSTFRWIARRKPDSAAADVMESRQAGRRAAQPFFFGGLCWRIQPSFFDSFDIMDQPNHVTVRPYIFGPLCPKCGQLRHRTIEHSRESSSPLPTLTALCFTHGCEHHLEPGSFSNMGLDDAKLDVYKAAQALALTGKPFPPGPCGKFAGP
jgi:hypothetical protein